MQLELKEGRPAGPRIESMEVEPSYGVEAPTSVVKDLGHAERMEVEPSYGGEAPMSAVKDAGLMHAGRQSLEICSPDNSRGSHHAGIVFPSVRRKKTLTGSTVETLRDPSPVRLH